MRMVGRQCRLVFFLFFLASVEAVAQITPVTDYPCDPRSAANNGTCPGGCTFAPAIEKGCNCFDSVDNDGDGKIDAADPECGSFFGLVFVGSGSSSCSIIPPGGNPFAGIGAPTSSKQNSADTQSKVAVGDVDGDGTPEAVITSKWNNEVRVVNPDGTIEASYNLSGKKNLFSKFTDVDGKESDPNRLLLEHEVLIADIKRAANQNPDGKGEVFAIVSNRGGNPASPPTGFYLLALTYVKPDPNGLQLLYDPVPLGTNRPGIPGIADMDGDGFAEIYLRDRIYAAETGKLLASEGSKTHLNTTLWDSNVSAGPAAVTVTGDAKMELICGTKVYTIPTLTNRTVGAPAALTLVKDMNVDFPATKCFVKLMNDPDEYGVDTHSSTSVADIDRDGSIDVVISGALNSSVGRTAVFYWNIAKNTLDYVLTPSSAELGLAVADPNFSNYQTGWIWGTGRVNIGDANGDGRSDLSFIAGNQLFCVTTNAAGQLVTLWTQNQVNTAKVPMGYRTINDSRSGVLAVTIYDFNNDGKPEMVYRDSQSLNVIDGATGQTLIWSVSCQSHTYTEGPVIADVNGDGATDICVTCNTNNSFDINDGIQQQALGQIRLYFSNTNSWLPTRKVWNQPGYFVVNINDDLTLPFPQLNQNLVFSNAPCPNGTPGPQQPLNIFLNQVPYMNADGCPVFPAPDLAFIGQDPATADPTAPDYFPAVVVTPPICGNLDIDVVFNIGNTGDLPISDNVPVSFFNGDPRLAGATRLHNTTIAINNLALGDTLTTAPVTFNGPGTMFDLYIVLYNDGSVLPLTLTGASPNECSIANNIYRVTVTPDPFTTLINKFRDNEKCVAADPNTGELRARIFKGAVEDFNFAPYSFQWYSGIGTTNPIPAGQGGTNPVITGLVEGDYTLVVTNTQKGCVGDPVSETINLSIVIPQVTVNLLSDQTQCSPPNGSLEAVIVGGNTGFTFDWFSNAIPLGISTPVANGLKGDNYTVVVSRNGCTTTATGTVADLAVEPDAQASVLQNVVSCTNPNSGSITGEALLAGVVQNPNEYTFDWYFYNDATSTRGSILPAANGTGPTRTGLAVGFYQLVVTRISTQCIATQTPIVEVTNSTVLPEAVIVETRPQTSCDPNQPNGVLTADVLIGGVLQNPANFTFEWFKGDNTLPANLHTSVSGTNGRVAEEVAGGGVFYTVRVTTINGCSDTEKLIITEDVNVPVVVLTAADNSICDPAVAGVSFNGRVSASVTFDNVAVTDFTNYQFTWHDGSQTTDPVIPVPDTKLPTLAQLEDGSYTVVVQRLDLFCTSLPETEVVGNAQVLPTITPDAIGSTNCAGGAPNGSVTVTNVVPAGPYTYKWYTGNSVNPGAELTPLNTATITALQGGQNFTVEVTLNASGCKSTEVVVLPDLKLDPILALDQSPNSICDAALGFNGSAFQTTLTDANALAGDVYDYDWSAGNDMSAPIAGQSGATLPNRDGGFYTAQVTNTRTNCISDPVTVEVINATVNPVITMTTTPSTNCAGGTPNGSMAADVGGVTAGFSFDWFIGNLITDPVVPVANGGETPTPSGLQGGGNFTVQVRNDATGCTNTRTELLADNKADPILTLAPPVPNSICDPLIGFNGSLAQNTLTDIRSLPGDAYLYTWSTGNDLTNPIAGQTSSTLTGQDGGPYTAAVLNVRTNCASAPVTVTIPNVQDFPDIVTSVQGSTNCDPLLKNGSATITTVDLGPPTGAYSYSWHVGNSVAGPSISTTPTASLLQGGPATIATNNYTVEVTNVSTGCKDDVTVNVPDLKELPELDLTPFANTICDPAKATLSGGTFDGQVQAVVTNFPTGGTTNNDYFFDWSTGADGNGVNALLNVDVGSYSVTALHNPTGCLSDVYSAVVPNGKQPPVIDIQSIGSQNCPGGTPDGVAFVNGVTPLGKTYAYNWYDGNFVSGPVQDTDATYAGVQGGVSGASLLEYTVEVTILESGCVNTATVGVADDSELPQLGALAGTDNEFCVGANGTATLTTLSYRTVAQAAPYTGFTFQWSNGNTTPATTTPLAAGSYTLVVTNTDDNCASNPVPITIQDDLYIPVINITPVAQTSCDVLNPNGVLTATVDETTIGGNAAENAGYTFLWRTTNDFPTGTDVTTTTAVNGQVNELVGNAFYTVRATRTSTGCAEVKSIFEPELIVIPDVALVATAQTECAPPNGSVAATVVPAPTGNYTYYWLKEQPFTISTDTAAIIGAVKASSMLPNRLASGGANDNHSGIQYGDYTLVVYDQTSRCISQPVTATVADQTNSTVNFAITTLPTSCLTNNGAFDIQANRVDAAVTTFTFEVFRGGPTNTTIPIDFTSNPPTFDPAQNVPPFPGTLPVVASGTNVNTNPTFAPGLSSSIYSIIATDGFGCKTLETFFLPFQDAHGINETVLDSKLCPYTLGDGSIAVNVIAPTSTPGANQTQFTYSFYEGGNPLPANLITPPSPFSYPVSTEVCNNGGDDDGDTLIDGADPDCTNSVSINALAPGFYTLEVQENISGAFCKVYEVVEVKALSLPPDLGLASALVANSACGAANFNGEIVLSVAKNPSDLNPDPVTYTILLNTAAFQAGVGPGNYPATNLAPAAYTFDVTASTGCVASRTYVIQDEPVVAQLITGDVNISPAQYCDPLLEESASVIIANVKLPGGANELITDYGFTWVNTATSTTLLTNVVSDGVPNNGAGGEEFVNNVPPGSGTVPAGTVTKGTYSVTVTKLTDVSGTEGVGCTSAPFNITITEDIEEPVITLTPLGDTSCDPTFFEGSILVNVVTPGPSPGAGGTYTYTWVPNGAPGSGAPANSVGNSGINNLQAGINENPVPYVLTARNEITGCLNSLATTVVRDTPPVFTLAALANNLTSCGLFDGSVDGLQVFINGGPGVVADFNYVWFENDPNTAPVLDGENPLVLIDDELTLATYPALGLNAYYVKAIRKAGGAGVGCESAPLRRDILDDRVYPQVDFTTISSTSCNTNYDGAITVSAVTQGFGAGTLYNFVWTADPGGAVVITDALGVTSSRVFQSEALGGPVGERIGPGAYAITVTNTSNSCFTNAPVTLQQNTVPVNVVSATSSPLTVCTLPGDGSVTVAGVQVNGVFTALGNFTFSWTGPGGPYGGATVSNLVDGDYFVTAQKTATTSPASGCSSVPFEVTVDDARQFPVLGFSTISNTSCNTNYDGAITVTANTTGFGPATLYTFDWTSTPVGMVITDAVGGSPAQFRSEALGGLPGERVGPGAYEITVTNMVNGCTINGQATLQQNTIPIEVTAATSTPLTHCTVPDGSVAVSGVSVNGAAQVLGDFSFNWSGNGGPYTGVSVLGLGAGTYQVIATKSTATSPASGCSTAPFNVTVDDERRFPTIAFATHANTACDGFFDGQITVTTATAGFGAGTTYDYDWISNPGGSTITDISGSVSPQVFQSESLGGPVGERIGPGLYEIRVTNLSNQCFQEAQVSIDTNPQPLDILTVAKLDQTICFPDGSITVSTLNSGGPGNYTYEWYRGSITSAPLEDAGNVVITGAALSTANYPTMGSGTFFVVATKNSGLTPGSGCPTPPFRVDVLDLHVDPDMTFTFTPNSSCNITQPNGIVLATATERDATIDAYTFAWQYNGGGLPVSVTQTDVANTSELTDSPEGGYALTVFNTLTGCSYTSNLAVTIDLSLSLPNIITVNKLEPTTCIGDGSAEVTSISIGGGPALSGAAIAPPNFEYEWYEGSFAPGSLLGTVTPLLAPIANGKYFVLVKDLTTDCKSEPTEVELLDQNIVYPDVEITLATPQISCDALIGTGVLVSTADGQTDLNANYTFDWYPNLTASGVAFASTSTITGVTTGDYSLEVTNLTTGCSTAAIYIVPNSAPLFLPSLSMSASERTLCVGQDGSIFAGIINIDPAYPFPLNYTANMYVGDQANHPNLSTLIPDVANVPPQAGFPQNFSIASLTEGFYTVQITDNNTGCVVAGATEVKDGRKPPVVVIREDNPMINCDPLKADGQLSATADGNQIAGYTFDWYAGTSVPASGTPLSSTDKLMGQGAGTYVVRVVRQLTGCFTDEDGQITDKSVLPPAPTALVERDRTNCDFPNGWVSANVDGSIIDHVFEWYDGNAIQSTSDFVGANYFDRDIGPYTVRATDIITGCISLPTTVTVQDKRITPEVALASTPALCLTPTGTVTLTLINNQEVILTHIAWSDNSTGGQIGFGPEVYELPAGVYAVDYTSSEGCEGSSSIEVVTEILSYNLVSVNGDGANDFWIVDCLQNFPDNNVKIFNRSGVKVFEADGYNNADVVFRGLGEQGVYALGNELPDGTYFYIIDKRDGSKPVTGYLELIR